ncbi:hypothetical protein [Nostoc sp. NMS8]|uniref:hypothetical protein n=1 Tax=Nostoc sp. NMS8 TaxID=2815392 RepID=UPI0025EA91EE|nr:hypothetical protein [Nostoc sp. NMS8]MBN3960103.1 hypothetical protein [Nostoc sp. NMS8]
MVSEIQPQTERDRFNHYRDELFDVHLTRHGSSYSQGKQASSLKNRYVICLNKSR